MKPKKLIILFTLFLWCAPIMGQLTPLEELAQLPDTVSIKERIALVDRIGIFFQTIKNEEEKKSLAKQYIQIATARRDSFFLSQGYFQQGDFLKQQQVERRYGLHLDDHSDEQSIYSNLNIYHDKTGNTSFEEIRNNDELFGNNNTSDKDYSYDPKEVYWAKLILYGDSEKSDDYLFHFSPYSYYDSWQKIDTWMVHANDSISYFQTGDQFRVTEKLIPSQFNMLRYTIQQNEKVVLYFRMEGVDEEKIWKPDGIRIYLLTEDKWPGFFLNYPFKGEFPFDDASRPFATNVLINHDFYIDSSGTSTIDEIVSNQEKLAWKDATKTLIEAETVYWLRKRFYGSPYFNGEQILHIAPFSAGDIFSFDYIDSYVSDGHGGFHHQRTGDHVPLKDRAFKHWAHFIKLDIGPTDTLDLWVRMEGADSRFIAGKTEMVLFHVDPFSLFPSQSNQALFYGLLFGIIGIQTIFFFLLFVIEKERIHLYFSLIGLGFFTNYAFDFASDFISYELFPVLRDYQVPLYFLGLIILSIGFLKFVETYFNYNKDSFYAKWLVPVLIFINLLACINAIFHFQYFDENLYQFNSKPYYLILLFSLIATIIVPLAAAIKAPQQKNVSKKFFFLAFSPIGLIGALYLANALYTITAEIRFSTTHELLFLGMQASVVAMLTLLALSIGHRTNRIKADKILAEQKNIFDQKEKDNAERIKRAAIELEKTNGLLKIQNEQNEVLLKEIHHRVKNNLQTISSLLSLQSNSIEDQGALNAVQESQNRVASMALIHQKLYQGENLAAIEMRDYFETIGKEILNSFGDKAKGVELDIDMSEIELDVDTAIPIGLITNELITNSLKYAFKEKEGGKISIIMKKVEDNLIQLSIGDNGTNKSKGISEDGTGFGTMLVKLLTTQLGGQLEQTTAEGTATVIKFSLEHKAA